MRNIATFHPSDNLILNDGVLWDVRTEKPIHKFDKFNQSINGVFHPNGQEIISNSEIVCSLLLLFYYIFNRLLSLLIFLFLVGY